MQELPKKGNYAFSVMLQDQKEQVLSCERSKAVLVAQHFDRKCQLTKGWGGKQSRKHTAVSISKHVNNNGQHWM